MKHLIPEWLKSVFLHISTDSFEGVQVLKPIGDAVGIEVDHVWEGFGGLMGGVKLFPTDQLLCLFGLHVTMRLDDGKSRAREEKLKFCSEHVLRIDGIGNDAVLFRIVSLGECGDSLSMLFFHQSGNTPTNSMLERLRDSSLRKSQVFSHRGVCLRADLPERFSYLSNGY